VTTATTAPPGASVTVDVLDAGGRKTGTVELPAEVFGAKVNVPLIHQVVTAQLAAARQGTHSTKGRGRIRGGGRKPYRQKGTGRARQGSIRAPQFTGGGIVHGPTPRTYAQKTPKKMKAAALRGALSDRARGGRVHVVNRLVVGSEPATKDAVRALTKVLDSLDAPVRGVLLVLDREDEVTWLSMRNVSSVHLLLADQLNTYDVLCSDRVVFTRAGYEAFLAHTGSAPARFSAAEAPAEKADEPAEDTKDTKAADNAENAKAPAAKTAKSGRKAAPKKDEQKDEKEDGGNA
jgi:large subunit ribosomal protein L4